MRIIRLLISSLIAVLLLSSQVLAYENLTELEARTSRKSTNTFYSGEDPGNFYIWQPQITIYKDTSTDREVWIWSQTDDAHTMSYGSPWVSTEWPWRLWSADGKRIAFHVIKDTAAFSRDGRPVWFVARSDGSYRRPFVESSLRCTAGSCRYFYLVTPKTQKSYTMGNKNCDRNL
jgi:hypothetical protein